mmetsp:Transcript_27206/g.65758  ORF Transcript_27206/g.65758 Transcript_27206/m.65758 type:complete len:201 (+) Transcript_27206:1104-1706(+)
MRAGSTKCLRPARCTTASDRPKCSATPSWKVELWSPSQKRGSRQRAICWDASAGEGASPSSSRKAAASTWPPIGSGEQTAPTAASRATRTRSETAGDGSRAAVCPISKPAMALSRKQSPLPTLACRTKPSCASVALSSGALKRGAGAGDARGSSTPGGGGSTSPSTSAGGGGPSPPTNRAANRRLKSYAALTSAVSALAS